MSTLSKKFSEDLVITKKRLAETEELVTKEIEGINTSLLEHNSMVKAE